MLTQMGYSEISAKEIADKVVKSYRETDISGDFEINEENPIKVHPNIIYSTFCGSRMFLFSVSPLSRNL